MITLRNYEPGDWQAICDIHDAARPDELRGSCDPRAFVPIQNDPEVKELESSKKVVAVNGDHVVGFVGTKDKEIGWLYVHPDFYSKGVGRKLLKHAIEKLGPGARTIVLEGNQAAINLYRSEGFSQIHRFESNNAGYPCVCLIMEQKNKSTSSG